MNSNDGWKDLYSYNRDELYRKEHLSSRYGEYIKKEILRIEQVYAEPPVHSVKLHDFTAILDECTRQFIMRLEVEIGIKIDEITGTSPATRGEVKELEREMYNYIAKPEALAKNMHEIKTYYEKRLEKARRIFDDQKSEINVLKEQVDNLQKMNVKMINKLGQDGPG